MMRRIIFIPSLMGFGTNGVAQGTYLSREAYRSKAKAYGRSLKQQRLKAVTSAEARKITQTGFLPKIGITAEGTTNLNRLDDWNSPAGRYRPYIYQALATLGQPSYTGGSLIAQKKIARADERLDRLTVGLTLDQIHYQSDAVYWNASAALAILEATARFEEIINQQYNIILNGFSDGTTNRTDLLMVSTRKKEAELRYIRARQNYTLALQQLNILMGAKPDAPVDNLCEIDTLSQPVNLLSLDEVLRRRTDYAGTSVNIAKGEAQHEAALSRYNPQLSMFLVTGQGTGIAYMRQDVPHTPIADFNLSIPIFRWGARLKTNRQRKAYISIQKLQQSYIADNILEELSAATTKLAETEQRIRAARENTALAGENLDLITFSYNEGKTSMVDMLST